MTMFNELPTPEVDLRQKFLELTKKQSGPNWTEDDRKELLELKRNLGIDQPLTLDQKEALHRQGLAGTRDKTGGPLHPNLTSEEISSIQTVNTKT